MGHWLWQTVVVKITFWSKFKETEMFRGPRDYTKIDMKQFGGHKDEVSYNSPCLDFFLC